MENCVFRKSFINFTLAINNLDLLLLLSFVVRRFSVNFGKKKSLYYRHQQEYELLFVMKLLMKELSVEKPKLNILHDLDYFPNFNFSAHRSNLLSVAFYSCKCDFNLNFCYVYVFTRDLFVHIYLFVFISILDHVR